MAETNPNRDTANAVYKPIHAARTVVSFPESAPTTATDGTDCAGYNVLAITRKNSAATTSAYTLWGYNGVEWFPAEVSTDLTAAEYDPTATWHHSQYNITGWFRYSLQAVSADGEVKFTENMQV